MQEKDRKTEQLIKETAKRIFLTEGKMFATTQHIANAAGVNRTLLHYYFRSREVLFNMVFKEALTNLRERLHEVLGSELIFREKIENLVTVFYEELTVYPYIETFVALHLNQQPEKYEAFFTKLPGGKERIRNFLKEIQQEMEKGTIVEMKPINFFINLFGLMAYPFVARPLYLKMFDLTDSAFNKLITERKKGIISLLFND